jgi:hypothetical protein
MGTVGYAGSLGTCIKQGRENERQQTMLGAVEKGIRMGTGWKGVVRVEGETKKKKKEKEEKKLKLK